MVGHVARAIEGRGSQPHQLREPAFHRGNERALLGLRRRARAFELVGAQAHVGVRVVAVGVEVQARRERT